MHEAVLAVASGGLINKSVQLEWTTRQAPSTINVGHWAWATGLTGSAAPRPLTAASAIALLGQSGQCPTSTRFRQQTD